MFPVDLGGVFGLVEGAVADKVTALFGNADTQAVRTLHAAAVRVDNARATGDTAALAAARTAFNAAAANNTTRVQEQYQRDTAPGLSDYLQGALARARALFTDAGMIALVLLVLVLLWTAYQARHAATTRLS